MAAALQIEIGYLNAVNCTEYRKVERRVPMTCSIAGSYAVDNVPVHAAVRHLRQQIVAEHPAMGAAL